LIGAGIFTVDPFNGYPPGTPLIPTVRTAHGIVHDLFGIPVFFRLAHSLLLFSRLFARQGERGWAAYSTLSGVGMLVAFVLTSLGINQVLSFAELAGLFQRLTLIIGLTWIMLLPVHFLRGPVRDSQKSGQGDIRW